jgi:hypothetical protein
MEWTALAHLIRVRLDSKRTPVHRVLASCTFLSVLFIASGCARPPEVESYTPGLGEIMTLNQMRHAKLWFAGQAGNWELAEYELEELNEGFEDVARFHPTHKDVELPIPKLISTIMTPPLNEVEEVAKAKDQERFVKAFDELTDACNRCHQATKFGFNVVIRPTANPYPNQEFQPAH